MTQQSTPAPTLASELNALAMNTEVEPSRVPLDAHQHHYFLLGITKTRRAIAAALHDHPKVQAYERLVEAMDNIRRMCLDVSDGNWPAAAAVHEIRKAAGDALHRTAALAAAERKEP